MVLAAARLDGLAAAVAVATATDVPTVPEGIATAFEVAAAPELETPTAETDPSAAGLDKLRMEKVFPARSVVVGVLGHAAQREVVEVRRTVLVRAWAAELAL